MERYIITLDSQLGARQGILLLEYRQSEISGVLSLLQYDNPVTGVKNGEHQIQLRHKLRTAASVLSCHTMLELNDNRITGLIKTGEWNMPLYGTRVSETAEGDSEYER